MFTRALAIDWSGRSGPDQKRSIWIAEADRSGLSRLECGRTREEVASHLREEARRDPSFVAGFDFAFSLPEWYLAERGITDARQLWALVANERLTDAMAEVGLVAWLRHPDPPFWIADKAAALAPQQEFRRTDVAGRTGGSQPKSVFQLVGAGQVGRASLYGMQTLHVLAQHGFHIWPWDEPQAPLVVEIYPRLLTGAVTRSSEAERARYLERLDVPDELRARAAANEDAFDAAVSALRMAASLDEFAELRPEPLELEGEMWVPREERPLRQREPKPREGARRPKLFERLPEQYFTNLLRSVRETAAREGPPLADLARGNPELGPPPHVVERLAEVARDPSPVVHGYAPFSGLPRLKEAIADRYRDVYGVELDPEREVAIIPGTKTALVDLALVLADAGEAILLPDPGYPDYPSGVALAGARLVPLPLDRDGDCLLQWDSSPRVAAAVFLNYL